MAFDPVNPPSYPPLSKLYAQGARGGGLLLTSGVVAVDSAGATIAAGDASGQAKHVLETIKAIVEEAGGTMADVMLNQIFLKDLGDYAAVNAVYADYFPANPPARYCVRADLIKPDWLVEIAATAWIGAQAESVARPLQ